MFPAPPHAHVHPLPPPPQTQGLGTALKILYSMSGDAADMKLTKSELSSFINAFGRISHSIEALKRFRALAEGVRPGVTAPASASPEASPPFPLDVAAAAAAAAATDGAETEAEGMLRAVDAAFDWILEHQVLSYGAFTLFILLWMR
jgi:hypothetical protein